MRELGQHWRFPAQVGFISPEEFEETKDVVGGLAYPAHQWGRGLHEANPCAGGLGFCARLALEGQW